MFDYFWKDKSVNQQDVSRCGHIDSSSLGEIYETFESMLGKIRKIISAKDPTLGLYE